MLKIKLARFGKKGQPHYRIVVNEARSKRDGKYVAALGHYAPTQTPKLLEIDVDAFKDWVSKGAQPTDTVAHLFERYQSGNPFPAKKARPSKKAQAKAAEAEKAKAEAKKASQAEKEAPAEPETPADKTTPATEAPAAESTATTEE